MARRSSPRFVVSIGAGAPPPWWPRKPDGSPERVYTADGTDWDLTRPRSESGTVSRAEIALVWAEWLEFYATDDGVEPRQWNLIAEPWAAPSGKSSRK